MYRAIEGGLRRILVGLTAGTALFAIGAAQAGEAARAAVPAASSVSQPAVQGASTAAVAQSPGNSAAGAAAVGARHAFTIKDYAELPFIEGAELSPNGQFVAGLVAVSGQRHICMFDLFNGEAPRVCLGIPDDTEPQGVQWVGNDNVVVPLAALRFVDGQRWYISRVLGLNRVTGKFTRLKWDVAGQSASDILWVARDGKPEILLAVQNSIFLDDEFWPAVWRVNVETGASTKVQRGMDGVMDWSADGGGQVRAGVGFNDLRHSYDLMYRGEHSGLHKVDTADYRKQQSLLEPLMFLPGDHALAIRDDEHGRSTLYEMDMNTGQNLRKAFEAPAGEEAGGIITDDAGTTLLGVRTAGAHGVVHWLDSNLAEVQSQLDKAVGDRRAWIMSLSADRKRMLVLVDRPNSPGALYFYDVNGGSMHWIAWMNEALKSAPLAPNSLVRYKAHDGLEIEGVLTLPPDRPARSLPVIVLPHGGPWAHDSLGYDDWPQFLAARGYAVIQPNFRGSTGYGEAFRRKGEGQMGLAMQDDLNDALKWLADQGIGDGKRACIVGASYGGYATMWGLERDADLWRCGISIAGVANVRREVNDMGEDLYGDKYKDDWKRMTPDFAAVSPANFVERIKAPLLLIHGKKDVTVDPAQSANMASKLRAAGKTFDYVSLPLADHHLGREEDRLTLLKAMAAWLDKYNPADPAPK